MQEAAAPVPAAGAAAGVPPPRYPKGSAVQYIERDGRRSMATVVSVDLTIQPPSYAVLIHSLATVRETEEHRLEPAPAPAAAPAAPAPNVPEAPPAAAAEAPTPPPLAAAPQPVSLPLQPANGTAQAVAPGPQQPDQQQQQNGGHPEQQPDQHQQLERRDSRRSSEKVNDSSRSRRSRSRSRDRKERRRSRSRSRSRDRKERRRSRSRSRDRRERRRSRSRSKERSRWVAGSTSNSVQLAGWLAGHVLAVAQHRLPACPARARSLAHRWPHCALIHLPCPHICCRRDRSRSPRRRPRSRSGGRSSGRR